MSARITERLQKPDGVQLERLTSKSGERCQAHISYRGKDGRFLQCTNSAYPGQSFCRKHLKMLRRLEMDAGTTPPTPADATSALARRDAKMKAAGMREAAGIAEEHTPAKHGGAPLVAHVTGATIRRAILARAEEIEKEALK